MAKVAILSDIHGNLEALAAVLSDLEHRGVGEIVCLGDIVGYGPDPVACVDEIRQRASVTICGNHDEALLRGALGFNQVARRAIEWTRRQLRPTLLRPRSLVRWRFLANLPLSAQRFGWLLVHGSPRDPTSEYVLPRHVAWPPPGMFEEIFAAFPTICFVGHTHVAGIFTDVSEPRFTPQSEIDGPFEFEGSKMLINVGSVGQPRDRDWRACYLIVDEGRMEYHRVEYSVERTQRKIRAVGDLDDSLAERLATGE